MFAPHHGKNAEFGVAGDAPKDFLYMDIFIRRQVVLGDEFGCDGWLAHGINSANRMLFPEALDKQIT
jgi:hypothetical protein